MDLFGAVTSANGVRIIAAFTATRLPERNITRGMDRTNAFCMMMMHMTTCEAQRPLCLQSKIKGLDNPTCEGYLFVKSPEVNL